MNANLIKNIISGTGGTLVNSIIQFIKIALVINILGNTINGLNNVYQQIMGFLLVAEGGLGIATTTTLYPFVVEKNYLGMAKVIKGTQIIYYYISGLILLICPLVGLVLPIIAKGVYENKSIYIHTFILFGSKALLPLIFNRYKPLYLATERAYIVNIFNVLCSIIISVVEIICIILFQSYFIMLFFSLIIRLIAELIFCNYSKKEFKDIDFKVKGTYTHYRHVMNLLFSTIMGSVWKGVDTLLISSILGLGIVSIYSNYNYLLVFITNLVGVMLSSWTHTIGIRFSEQKLTNRYFNNFLLFTGSLSIIVSIGYYLFANGVINLWIGPDNMWGQEEVFLFALIIYINLITIPYSMVLTISGQFEFVKKNAIITTILNLLISILLVNILHVKGVLLATIISFLLYSFWKTPLVVGKVISHNYKLFYKINLVYLISMMIFIRTYSFVKFSNFFEFIISGLICLPVIIGIVSALIFILYRRDLKNVSFKSNKV